MLSFVCCHPTPDPNIPFVPSITPSIPYSEPTRCYELCHLSDNETELINDSLSKYAYNDCPHRDSIAEEVRSDPFYNRCRWSPDSGQSDTTDNGSGAGDNNNNLSTSVTSWPDDGPISSSSSSSVGTHFAVPNAHGNGNGNGGNVGNGRGENEDENGDERYQHEHDLANNRDDLIDDDGEIMRTKQSKKISSGHVTQWSPQQATKKTKTTTSSSSSSSTKIKQNMNNDDVTMATNKSSTTTANEQQYEKTTNNDNEDDTTTTTTTVTQHPAIATGQVNGYAPQSDQQQQQQQQHVHNKTLAELRDILHQYKSQPKHRPGEHGSGSHLHHLHNGADYSHN